MPAGSPLVPATLLVLGAVLPAPSARLHAQVPSDRADAVIAAAREALGGAERLAGVRALVATGRTRQVQGNNLLPIEIEMAWQAPDKYVRREEFPTQDRAPVTTGFNGDTLLNPPGGGRQGPPAGRGGPPPPSAAGPDNGALVTMKEDLARLMLGLFAGATSIVPVTFRYFGVAEAPQGEADVLDVSGPGTFAARLFVDRVTHLPIMVSWQATRPPGGPAPAGPGPTNPGPTSPAPANPEPASRVEHRLYFGEHRDVDGLHWPFRIRRALGADPTDETNVDTFRVNASIDPRRFEVRP